MAYYNQNKELVDKDYSGLKWFTPVEVPEGNLENPESTVLVFDEHSLIWKIQSTLKKDWQPYLVSIGKLTLDPRMKLDPETGEIIPKTNEELVNDNLITKSELIDSLSLEIESYYVSKTFFGITHNGYRFRCDEISKGRVSEAVLEMQTFPADRATTWISECQVDANGVDIEGTENAPYQITSDEILLNLAKAIKDYWKTCFYTRRMMLDGLPSKSEIELAQYDVFAEWQVDYAGHLQ